MGQKQDNKKPLSDAQARLDSSGEARIAAWGRSTGQVADILNKDDRQETISEETIDNWDNSADGYARFGRPQLRSSR